MKTIFNFSGVYSFDSLIRANDRFFYTILEKKPVHFFKTSLFFLENKDDKILEQQYTTALGILFMIDKWHQAQRVKGTFPYIELLTIIDPHSSIIETKLNGIKRHIDDPFWDTYFPLNFEQDRSTVKSIEETKESPLDDLPQLPSDFKRNFAKPFIIPESTIPFIIPYIDENVEILKSSF